MVKTPSMRHSKSPREPVTINLDASPVARTGQPSAGSEPSDEARPDEAGPVVEEPASVHEEADESTAANREAAAGIARDTVAGEPTSQQGSAGDGGYQAATQAGRSGRDGFSRIIAGVVGAAIALVVAAGATYSGLVGGSGNAKSDAALQSQIDGLKQQIAGLKAAPQDDLTGRVDGLSGALDALKTEIAGLKQASSTVDPALLQGLDDRLKSVEAALSSLPQGGNGQQPADASALGDKIAALEARLKAASDAAAAATARVAALEQSVSSQASQPKVALSLASAALRSALERGSPFSAELDTLAALSDDVASISALRPYAESGVATLDALVADAETAAPAMIAAADPPDENAGFLSRLLHSAGSLVTVRPIGAIDGPGAAAALARMEAAIKEGRLDGAVAEFDALPEASKAAGASLGERLKARQAADQLVAKAIAAATKA